MIVIGYDKLRVIVFDLVDDKVYWIDWGIELKVLRVKMSDGIYKEVFVNLGIVWLNGFILDYGDNMLYWVDVNIDKVEKF